MRVMPSVFISYRREDSAGFARAIYERLADEFDRKQLFMDVDAIEPGVDFVDAIDAAVAQCDALIALIGKQWLSIEGTAGARLDDPTDYVRIEIATALRRGIRVIPLLVNDADMPSGQDLPEELKPLARRNALALSMTRFAADMDLLIRTLHGVVESVAPSDRARADASIDKTDYVGFLEQAISTQQLAQRFHVILAIAVAGAGLAAIVAGQTLSGVLFPEDQKTLITLGGGFLSALSAFPFKQFADRRTRLSALEFLINGFRRLGEQGENLSGAQANRLTESFWKLMDASLGMQTQ